MRPSLAAILKTAFEIGGVRKHVGNANWTERISLNVNIVKPLFEPTNSCIARMLHVRSQQAVSNLSYEVRKSGPVRVKPQLEHQVMLVFTSGEIRAQFSVVALSENVRP